MRAQQVRHHGGRGQRVDRQRQRALGPRPVREPAVGLTGDEDADGRAVGDLLLQLPGQRQATGGLRLPVEDAQVDAAAVDGGDDLVAGGALEPGDRADVGGRTRPTAVRTASRTSDRWL